MDRGELVPDAVTIDMLLERLAKPDAAAGILLDGFPRNTAQAEVLDRALAERGGKVDVAPYIEVPEADLVARLGGRWICRAQGHPYHEQTKPPLGPGICDVDGSELYQRDRRPAGHGAGSPAPAARRPGPGGRATTAATGVLATVDGRQPIERVTDDLLERDRPGDRPAGLRLE